MIRPPSPVRVAPSAPSWPTVDQIVRVGRPRDLSFLLHLHRKNDEALGFIPRQGMLSRLEDGEVKIALENGEHAGYLLFAKSYSEHPYVRPIFQACVDFDLRRRDLGLELVRSFEADARRDGIACVRLWCRASLPSNAFWSAAGFTLCGQREGGKKRKTPCNLWAKLLRPFLPAEIASITNPSRGAAGMFAPADGCLKISSFPAGGSS
jgi:hypothetical protein